jgi:hypothetical protein
VVCIPITPTILPVTGVRKVGGEIGDRVSSNVKITEHHHCNSPNPAQFNMFMAQNSMLVDAAGLIMLSIICQDSEDLNSNVLVVCKIESEEEEPHTGASRSSPSGIEVLNRSDQSRIRALSPLNAVAAPIKSIARSRKPR